MTCISCDRDCEGFGNYRIHNGDLYCDSCYETASERGDFDTPAYETCSDIPNCPCGCNKPATGCRGNCRFGVEGLCGHCLPHGLHPCELAQEKI